ncbi:MAG: thiamine pyrophosphate-binding protein [Rhodospirillaceae bacterium]|jgi:acetolactate synthase I/II/III large subunit|nr:thiamine pyrophosphate-binding protein [Rhodospirillaceae bacterium]MBT5665420.1 thiamine pyrophosphate-binding protein [Rhodospirillaceae bacterium]MBT5809468.1 thiamine pyrophosphate-binding protein [Rhodospirillaceae bacterium]
MNNADLIVATLKAAGVRHGFGVPSGNVLPMVEAMQAGGVDFVLTAHEGSAGFCADVTGRMTGAPGFAIATLGPGATNLATGVGSAYLDRSPMIALTCNLNTDQLGRRIQMYIDHHALFKPITKASFALREGSIAETMQRAIEIAMSEPQGPVHLDLPEDVAVAMASEAAPNIVAGAPIVTISADAVFEDAAGILAAAKRPLALVGMSAMRMADPALLRTFVERHGLPFASTTMAKGLIDEDHPLSVGCIERGCRQLQRQLIRDADLVIGLGYDTIETEAEAWIGDTPLLQIDIEAVDVDETVTVAGAVTGDLDASFARLNAMPPAINDWTEEEIAARRDAFQQALRPAIDPLCPHQVIDAVRDALPRDGVLSFDVGAHTHQIASQWTAHAPRTFLITNGWSSMGFGLPGAIAAKLARPDLPVACIVGDGCFQMTCGEVAVARRQNLAIPFVILNDQWLSLIRVKQTRRQYADYGMRLLDDPADAANRTPAHYFDVPAVGVTDLAGLQAELTKAFAADGPTVIEAYVDSAHYMDTVFD